jgi:hypothetical protein
MSQGQVFFVAASIFVLATTAVRADESGRETLELIVRDSELVLRGVYTEVTNEKDPENQFHPQRVTMTVRETIKGPPQGRITFILAKSGYAQHCLRNNLEAVVCLVRSERYKQPWNGYQNTYLREAGCEWVCRVDQQHRSIGCSWVLSTGIIDCSAITNDFRLLRGPGQLLPELRRAAAEAGGRITSRWVYIEVPDEVRMNRMSGQYGVLMPADALEDQARQWIKLPDRRNRMNAALVFEKCPSAANAALLSELLDDGNFYEWGEGRWQVLKYPVRERAWYALQEQGVPVEKPVLLEPEDSYQPIPTSTITAGAVVVVISLAAAFLLGVRGRRPHQDERARRIRSWRPPVRVVVSTVLLVGIAAAWQRSLHWIDHAVHVTPAAGYHEFSAHGGRLRYLRIPGAHERVSRSIYCTLPRNDTWSRAWDVASLEPTSISRALGFVWATGKTPGPIPARKPWTYGVWEVPYWSFAVLTAFLPVAWLTGRWRRYRRVQRNCCDLCGYDLRASTHRCPECGIAVDIPDRRLSTSSP